MTTPLYLQSELINMHIINVIHAKVNIYGNRCSHPRETYRADKDKNLCVRA